MFCPCVVFCCHLYTYITKEDKAIPKPTFCIDCRHVHEAGKKISPFRMLCNRHKRLEGQGFIHPDWWVEHEPFLRCIDVNGGMCPLFEPAYTEEQLQDMTNQALSEGTE